MSPRSLPQSPHVDLKPLIATKHYVESPNVTTSSAAQHRDLHAKEASVQCPLFSTIRLTLRSVLLLSLHSILLMATKEMIDMAVAMLRPSRRDAAREHTEDCMPMLERAVNDFKALAYETRTSMLAWSGSMTLARAQDALNSLENPYFLPEFTWGVDQISLEATRANIASFYDASHFGLVYVLQTKLLQAGVLPTRDEVTRLLLCKQHFMQELNELIDRGHLPFSFPSHWRQCQMFAPRELIGVPAVANHVLHDRRPDYLGRLSFHILSDAGARITWESSSHGGPGYSLNMLSHELGPPVEWPIKAINTTDVLGRTALHIAVRQGSISSVMHLSRGGANIHQLCLNGLSLLHIAACHGHTTVVRHLIDKMYYHECGGKFHKTGEQCQECEVRYSHQLDELDDLWRTPFWYAARGSHFEVMALLTEGVSLKISAKQFITVWVNTEHEDSRGHSALATAARDGRVDVLTFLLDLRSKTWNPLLEQLMPNEHLLLAYAVQSKNRGCIKLVLSQRRWRFGGRVFDRAMAYAGQNHDKSLKDELLNLYKFDEAVRTANPVTGLTHLISFDIAGIDYINDVGPFDKQFPDLGQALDLGLYSSNGQCNVQDSSFVQTEGIATVQEDTIDDCAG